MAEKSEPKFYAIRAPRDVEGTPPAMVNHVNVRGSTDALVYEFFYVPEGLRYEATIGVDDPRFERPGGEMGTIRLTPAARLGLPITVVLELLTDSFRVALEEAPGIKDQFERAVKDIQEALAKSPLIPKPK